MRYGFSATVLPLGGHARPPVAVGASVPARDRRHDRTGRCVLRVTPASPTTDSNSPRTSSMRLHDALLAGRRETPDDRSAHEDGPGTERQRLQHVRAASDAAVHVDLELARRPRPRPPGARRAMGWPSRGLVRHGSRPRSPQRRARPPAAHPRRSGCPSARSAAARSTRSHSSDFQVRFEAILSGRSGTLAEMTPGGISAGSLHVEFAPQPDRCVHRHDDRLEARGRGPVDHVAGHVLSVNQ